MCARSARAHTIYSVIPMLIATLFLPIAASTASECIHEFRRCRAYCGSSSGHERSCVTSCAKTSALCQQAAAPAVASTKVATAERNFAFTDANGDRFLPFGFYQYTVTKELDIRLPGEEAVHGMTLTSPYASTAAPDDAWWGAMQYFLDAAAAAGFRVNFQLIGFETLGNDVSMNRSYLCGRATIAYWRA